MQQPLVTGSIAIETAQGCAGSIAFANAVRSQSRLTPPVTAW
jgi:hypothetical protein